MPPELQLEEAEHLPAPVEAAAADAVKPPVTRRRFTSAWEEFDYICEKLHYWLYVRKQKARACGCEDRLERVSQRLPSNDDAILRHEGLALLYELNGEMPKAINHRKQEIALMQRLQRDARYPRYTEATRVFMLQDRGTRALQELQVILDALTKTHLHANSACRSSN